MVNPHSPDEATDRNLLFGILALQNNFIDREALLAAFAAWIVDKQRPLGEILCEQGKLSRPQEEWLRGLMEQHAILHQGDPEQSLAAVSTIGSIREDLQRLGDPQLDATLDFVARDRPESNFASAASVGEWSGKGQRFRVLRSHAKGGLGEVFVAEDLELRREVAIKEIQLRHADHPASRSRFLLEAEITGGLEHPGIVPVYGMGQYADGRPFYAMRFIRGDSMKDAIDRFHKADVPGRDPGERTLELRKLLGRFIDVCEAIEYAHSRGVLHRDLKPANIMLGNYGETLVVDWGLAKAAGRGEQDETDADKNSLHPAAASGSEPTAMGAAIGTPAYMSPEQAAGRPDVVGPASDVYGLGATLYHLLTGQTPVTGKDVSEVLGKVQQGEILPPRARNPRVPAALAAVCAKAMARDASARYASPRILVEDLEHWMADEPVSCLAEPLAVRTRRWMKRHRTLVSSSAAAVVVLVTSLVVLLALVAGHNRTLDVKNRQLDDANSKLTKSNTDLQRANASERAATTKAEANATVAREQSQLALKSLASVIFDIQRKLNNVPGAGDLQRALLQTALVRLQEVSDQFASRSAIDRNTKIALDDLGNVFLRIGPISPRPSTPGKGPKGEGPSSDADGPLTAARKVYQQAFEIAEKLVAADPSDAQAQRDLYVSYNKLGDVQFQSGQTTEAVGSYQKGLVISKRIAAANPSNFQAQGDLFVSYDRLGDVLLQTGQVTEALVFFQEALEISQKLAAANPSDAQAHRGLSIANNKLGDVRLQSGQVTEALGFYQKAMEISQTLAAADPSDARAQRNLSTSYTKLGNVQLQSGQVTEALGSYQKDMEISRKLAAADPSDAQAQRDLSISHEKLGDVQLQSGQATEAIESFREGLEISQKLAAADPSDARAQLDLVVSFQKIGAVRQEQRQFEQAMESYGQGLKVLQSLREQTRLAPAHEQWIGVLEQSIQQCRHAAMALGDWQTLLEQTADVLPVLLEVRGMQFVRERRLGDAVQAVAKLRELGTATADQLYNAACVYCLCAAAIKPDKDGKLTAEQSAARQKHFAHALETLREAIKAGYKDFDHLQKDPDLAPLGELPEFKMLLPEPEK